MNKMTVILIVALIAIIYFALDKFLTVEESLNTNPTTEIGSDFTAIKPPTFTTNSGDKDISKSISYANNKEGTVNDKEKVKTQRKINRQELINFAHSKNKSFESLGSILEKIKSNPNTSSNVKDHLERTKYNLEVSKKIAALTQKLYDDVDGEKEFNQDVLDLILAGQKKLIFPTGYLNFTAEGMNAN